MAEIPDVVTKKKNTDLQETFMEDLLQRKVPVSCYLVNGIRLSGIVLAMDRYTLLLGSAQGNTPPQLVYKAAISTIAPTSGTGR